MFAYVFYVILNLYSGPKDARSLGEPSASDESPIEGDDEGLNTTVPVTPTNNNCPKSIEFQ